jgi:pimeloyl-ACP methyl ester carboxylesterase
MATTGLRVVKVALLTGLVLVVTVLVVALAWRTLMQSEVRRKTGITAPGGVDSLEEVSLGGLEQWLLIRGWDRSNPVLLHLHGGPGSADISIARFFDTELVKHFTVVHWDQRGAGKSFSPDIPPESMTREQFVADVRELSDMLRKRFGVPRIYLVGHSWGSEIGALAASRNPELFHAYVGVGQVVEDSEQERISYQFALDRARETGNQRAIRELREVGPPPYGGVSQLLVQRKWLERFGGVSRSEGATMRALIERALSSPDYSIADAARFFRGQSFSLAHMFEEGLKTNLFQQAPRIEVPAYFLCGRHDYNTPCELAERYYRALEAPRGKHFIWFEDAAHMLPYEVPDQYADALIDRVLKETRGG